MKITEEEMNEYRRKHNIPIPIKDAEKARLLAENQRLRADNERLRVDNEQLRAENGRLVADNELSNAENGRLVAENKKIQDNSEWSPLELTLDKKWCRQETKRLIRCGKITPTPCEVCGSINVHVHHPDYADPYNVRFLCPYHHYELHYRQCRENGEDGQFFKMLMGKC